MSAPTEQQPAANARLSDATVGQEPETTPSEPGKLASDDASSQGENDSQPGTTSGTVVVPHTSKEEQPAEEDEGPLILDWSGPEDPENPRNWQQNRKWGAALTVAAFAFISPVASSIMAPASIVIAREFHIESTVEVQLTITIYILAYAVGPLILAPLSELYGRVYVLQLANAWFIIWNFACGWTQNKEQLIAFRFLAGLGGSACLAVGGAVLSDMWTPDKRGQAIALYSLSPLLGPVVGPIAGGFIAENTTWHWCFWSVSALSVFVQGIGLLYLQETFAPVLLGRKAKQLRREMAQDPEKGKKPREVRTVHDKPDRHWRELFARAMIRPFVLFGTEPIIQLFGAYLAFAYGLIYLNLTIIPTMFTVTYHESLGIEGLNYISLGLGLIVAAQINSRLLDRVYQHYKKKNGGVGQPEFRLVNMVPGTILLPIGLFIAGWGAQEKVFWLVPDIGFFFIGAGIVIIFQGLQSYIIDAFTQYAASALAAVSCFRALAGFGFPLFAPAMYKALGYGKGNTILAIAAIFIGIPAMGIFMKYGKQIRMASKRARKREAFWEAQRQAAIAAKRAAAQRGAAAAGAGAGAPEAAGATAAVATTTTTTTPAAVSEKA